ncbi:MAG: hypothetical protein Q8J84_08800 [Flavobacteriaceae bacterium]|nr:hypothetical protein [Flavobacteriaceae bacterium]
MDKKLSENKIRAEIIGGAINVEDNLTEILSYLYSSDELYRYQILKDILAELTFDKKIRLFEKFVKMMPETIEDYPKLIKELNHIRNVRNQMAHRTTSNFPIFEEHDKPNTVRFLKYGKEDFSFSIEESEQFVKDCNFLKYYVFIVLERMSKPLENNVS